MLRDFQSGANRIVVTEDGSIGFNKTPARKLDMEFDSSPATDGMEIRNLNGNGGATLTLSAGTNSLSFTSWGNTSSGYAHSAIGTRGNRFLLFTTFDP